MNSNGKPIQDLAAEVGVSPSYFTRVLRLSFLAPEITRAIIQGRQPVLPEAASMDGSPRSSSWARTGSLALGQTSAANSASTGRVGEIKLLPLAVEQRRRVHHSSAAISGDIALDAADNRTTQNPIGCFGRRSAPTTAPKRSLWRSAQSGRANPRQLRTEFRLRPKTRKTVENQ